MKLRLNAGRQAEQWEDTYSFPWDALKMSNVQEHLLLVSSLHPFLLILLSCCLNLCPAMRFFLFCVTVVSWVCLPHYSVISFRLEVGLLCICTSAWIQVSGKWCFTNMCWVRWDLTVPQMLCVVSLRLGEHFYFLSVQSSVLGMGTTCFCICPRRCCTSRWEPHQRTRNMLIKHADSSAVAVSSAEEIN